MSAQVKQRIIFDATTMELWSVAEHGDLEALAEIWSRGVDVNAGNEHGMTALMRAAYHGHTSMVRALLERGADPNIARHDRFTALALAAFFGHTETVRLLIEHGARTEVVTRSGTSPRMWAIARTFDDAARCLEQKSSASAPASVVTKRMVGRPVVVMPMGEKPVVERPVVQRPVAQQPLVEKPIVEEPMVEPLRFEPLAEKPLVIKTLSEPPEIWDLVQPAPRSFTARSAFVSRLGSTKAFAVTVCALLLLIVAGGVGVLFLRSSAARELTVDVPPVPFSTAGPVSAPASAATSTSVTAADDFVSAPVITKRSATHYPRNRSAADQGALSVVESGEAPTAPPVASPSVEKPKTPETTAKRTETPAVSPQLVTPAKNAAPKAKVIQWP